jgi:Escherichia/Staphylococcus phage prohead protease
MQIERKVFESKAQVESEDSGIVHAVVSVFGNVDSDRDILQKGAFTKSIEKAKGRGKYPPGVYMHDWSLPVAKTLDMWEAEDGLHVIGQFALYKQIGKDTFLDIKNGLITEYSFGFKTVKDEQKEDGRHILDVEMYEWSPVLYGANSLTHTVGVKDDYPHAGLTLDQHFEKAHAALSEFIKRIEGLAELRQKEGRTLSDPRREQIKDLQERIGSLLSTTEPKATQDEIQRLWLDTQINLARINHAL